MVGPQLTFTSFQGLRVTSKPCTCSFPVSTTSTHRACRTPLLVVAAPKSQRKQQVVLVEDIPNLGPKGTLTAVKIGYYRNYLLPQNLAKPATVGILANIQREKESQEKAALQVKARAKAMSIALGTIGKFIIKKKVGEGNKIFGSVTPQEVVDAIEQQTGRQLDKRMITLPEISTTGTFDASVKLHPEVIGEFKVVIQREKNVS